MHVAVVGMGALGRVYGVRLVTRGGCSVTFVVKPGQAACPLHITRIDGDWERDAIEAPATALAPPADADAVLVCVRAEQLDAALDTTLAHTGASTPVVLMTPVFPRDLERIGKAHGARVRVGMPGVVAYVNDRGVCRYWLPRVAPTLIDAAPPVGGPLQELTARLATAGFGAKLEAGVRETNPATTVSFIPLAMGIDAAGGVDALLADKALLRLSLDAVAEGLALAALIGQTPTWVALLARFAGPTSLKIGVGIARSRAPEALAYVEHHFGRKLHAQNVAMARAMVALADDKGTPRAGLQQLLARLEAAA